jgi:hypothetical protein
VMDTACPANPPIRTNLKATFQTNRRNTSRAAMTPTLHRFNLLLCLASQMLTLF